MICYNLIKIKLSQIYKKIQILNLNLEAKKLRNKKFKAFYNQM